MIEYDFNKVYVRETKDVFEKNKKQMPVQYSQFKDGQDHKDKDFETSIKIL